ncbi:MAG: type I DNA topoisomerase [Patescibacteria group bacterium]
MKLVIVESPTKAKTLSKILGEDYIIKASMGHIRDLPKKKLGVSVEDGSFLPEYEIPSKSKKVITALKKDLTDVDTVVLATDPDREGEAIAWHLMQALTTSKNKKSLNFERVVFHELTKEAVEAAFSHPGKLNIDLVDAQQARRVLDRLVGYKLSPLLWKKVRYGLSAGRVQSVAVRLIVEKERERNAFKPEEYWTLDGLFENNAKVELKASLFEKDSKKLEIKTEKTAKEIEKDLKDATFLIAQVKKSERKRKPGTPFKTSTLQQTAANTLGFSAKRTMSAAQKLFEAGHITYHRTDSLSLAPQFVEAARNFVKKDIGANFVPENAVEYKTTTKNAQEAHEAIRPTDVKCSPKDKKITGLSLDEKKVYSLIWRRSIESQMVPAVYDQTSIVIGSNNGYNFKASGSVIKFDGWLAIGKKYGLDADKETLNELPDFSEGEQMALKNIISEQHFTQPPARYSDATLIKALEELGIGRPSTYAPTISTIIARGYVHREQRYFYPEDVAYVVNDLLIEHFDNIVDYEFTAQMEEKFDKIAEGQQDWIPMIKDFYTPFDKILEEKDKELQKADVTKLGESEEKCPECGKVLYIKLGKYGKFLSCSGFPDCEYAKPIDEEQPKDENGNPVEDFGKCENCEDGTMILKQGRFGKFLACSNYPKCKTTKPYLDKIGMDCPQCEDGEVIVKKAKGRVFYGCSNYPKCKYASWKNPLQGKDDEDASDLD